MAGVVEVKFKILLAVIALFFAGAATILIILGSSAATVTGSSPFMPISLVEEANTGVLRPGEERWFRFMPGRKGQTGQVERSLALVFTPGDGPRSQQVALQIFDESQILFYYKGSARKMTNLGAGQVVARDSDPHTGELFWTGWLPGQQNFYIQLVNGSRAPIDYWLFTDDVNRYELADPTPVAPIPAAELPVNTGATDPPPEKVTSPTGGNSPLEAQALVFGLNKGRLNPGEETWYNFVLSDNDDEHFESMTLTMIMTPDNGNRIQNVSFDIFSEREIQQATQSGRLPENLGSGGIVQRDQNPLTGERVWDGWLIDGDRYYVRVHNAADVPVDFWLSTDDVYNYALGHPLQVKVFERLSIAKPHQNLKI